MGEHTELPWRRDGLYFYAKNGFQVLKVNFDTGARGKEGREASEIASANAALIAKAVNMHGRLVANVRSWQEEFCRENCGTGDPEDPHLEECDDARALLAEAEKPDA